MARPKYTPEQRISKFWAKVNITADNEQCWEWQGGKDKDGYGGVRIDPHSSTKSHRFSWMITYGEIPDNLFVLHKCDKPSCCNPKHLFLGTTQENTKDRYTKGRSAKGEEHGNHKLLGEEVDCIREEHALGVSTKVLAERFNVHTSTIHNIVTRKQWKSRQYNGNRVEFVE